MTETATANVLVLGASGFYGGAIAKELLSAGMKVGLHGNRRTDALQAFVHSFGDNAKIYASDLTVENAPETLLKAFTAAFGRLDALIWAAGITREALAARLSSEEFRAVLDLNLTAPFFLLKTAGRIFMKQRSGAAIFLGSHAGITGRIGGAAYATAQSGLTALVKSAAREFGAFGVRVNVVVPPFTAGKGLGEAASEAFAAQVRGKDVLLPKKSPTGDAFSPAELEAESKQAAECTAAFIRMLLEKPGARASGQVFVVDGRPN